jgi:hypothetical protein
MVNKPKNNKGLNGGTRRRFRRVVRVPRDPWIPKSWRRITARRLVIVSGLDHYWNFHKRPEPGCPVCWQKRED